jgi:hypothetical protein
MSGIDDLIALGQRRFKRSGEHTGDQVCARTAVFAHNFKWNLRKARRTGP